jgi:hypothetical protein
MAIASNPPASNPKKPPKPSTPPKPQPLPPAPPASSASAASGGRPRRRRESAPRSTRPARTRGRTRRGRPTTSGSSASETCRVGVCSGPRPSFHFLFFWSLFWRTGEAVGVVLCPAVFFVYSRPWPLSGGLRSARRREGTARRILCTGRNRGGSPRSRGRACPLGPACRAWHLNLGTLAP